MWTINANRFVKNNDDGKKKKCTTTIKNKKSIICNRQLRRWCWTSSCWTTCTRICAIVAAMLAGVLDRVLSSRRRSQYLHRVNVERAPRPPAPPLQRPHSYHGGRNQLYPDSDRGGALRANGRKLAAKFWSSCGSSRAAAAATATRGDRPAAAVRKRAATTTNGGFSNLSHTWRFKRLR